MGFRSVFIAADHYLTIWPDWFLAKWGEACHFAEGRGAFASKRECKAYVTWRELPADVQRAVDWDADGPNFVIVFLHECGGVTRCQIMRDRIIWSEPTGWEQTDGITHDYCYGCSNVATQLRGRSPLAGP